MRKTNDRRPTDRFTHHGREQALARDLTDADVKLVRRWGVRTLQRNGNTRIQITESQAAAHGRQVPELFALVGATVIEAPDLSVVTVYWYRFALASPRQTRHRAA